jgi:tetratricopeptide (TPR) repeat protein
LDVLGNLTSIREESHNLVGHKLARTIFEQFENPNHRLIIGVACLREGDKELAFSIFTSIIKEGPKENKDQHFAYVRSLIEIAELEAEKNRFAEAREHMRGALEAFPEKMGYMMSRVHLEVYFAYYCFRSNRKEDAYEYIAWVCTKEQDRFHELPVQDANELVGPGLCYAIHQWALFYVEEGDWARAILKFKEIFPYTSVLNRGYVSEAEELESRGDLKRAFYRLEEAVYYI